MLRTLKRLLGLSSQYDTGDIEPPRRTIVAELTPSHMPPSSPRRAVPVQQAHVMKLPGELLPGGGRVNAVGESRYQDSLEAIAGGKKRSAANIPVIATLVREPRNQADPNAVMIVVEGLRVGYLSRADAIIFGPTLDDLLMRGKHGQCAAVINGGWKRESDEGNFGIVLDLKRPRQ